MGRRTHLPLALALAVLVCALCAPVLAVGAEGTNEAPTYFSNQLNDQARAIYDELSEAFESGAMMDGVSNVDITDVVSAEDIERYAEDGERQLFQDFSAAKDAFDLEHPEAWYIDSSFLCLRVGKKDGAYKAYIGPGRADTYYLNGQTEFSNGASGEGRQVTKLDEAQIQKMDEDLEEDLKVLVKKVSDVTPTEGETDESLLTRRLSAAHDAVVNTISYRFENECLDKSHTLFVRTIYGVRTHEGVCEAYARTLQYVLNKVNIPCILISGLQTSGDSPEQHMWCAVKVNDVWYGVDPTWDDPIKLSSDVATTQAVSNELGVDGGERRTYFLVGTGTLANWIPNGVFSAEGKEFAYPAISETDYEGGVVFDEKGLTISYSSAADMEGAAAGAYIVRYKGKGILAAGEQGIHLLVKEHYAGGQDEYQLDRWHYVEASLYIMEHGGGPNEYFNDDGTRLVIVTPSCDYVEFALTEHEPEGYHTWKSPDVNENVLFKDSGRGAEVYYDDGAEGLICKTGQLWNVNSNYRPAPYVKLQYPTATSRTATETHTARVMFDDALTYQSVLDATKDGGVTPNTRPDKLDSWPVYESTSSSDGNEGFEDLIRVPESEAHLLAKNPYVGDKDKAPIAKIHVSYLQKNYLGEDIEYKLKGDVNYDTNKDGYVDAETEGLNWLYRCNIDYPHKHVPYGYDNAGVGCQLVGVEFTFTPSKMWADDLTYYEFQIEGLVGSHSGYEANPWGYLVCDPMCPMAYRSQGIDWSLWGRPNLLDNPGDLDLDKVVLNGVDDESSKYLSDLQEEMNLERLDGRLVLVAEDLTNSLNSADKDLTKVLEDKIGGNGKILGKSMYEINFSNICKKTISEVKDGDYMRVQVGFPADYDASSSVVFKAYHFTRNEDGSIKRVEEIPVVVTPYGLIVLCDSFSPFEMVAMSPDAAMALSVDPDPESDVKRYDRCVVVASDGHVKVSVDDVEDATHGAQSIVDLSDGKAHTFTFVPDEGYEVQGVTVGESLCGLTDAGNGAKTLTLSASQLKEAQAFGEGSNVSGANAILSVTSIAESVADADKELGFEEVVPVPGDPMETAPTEDPAGPQDDGTAPDTEGTEKPADGDVDRKPGDTDASNGTDGSGDVETGAPDTRGDQMMTVHRLYNPNTGEHLFTYEEPERDELTGHGWVEEGVAWLSPLDSGTAVYRVRNPYTLEHHYTVNLYEVQNLVRNHWEYEGFAWRNGPEDADPVYRLYNPYIDGPGAHLYTTDPNEYETLSRLGWQQESVAWYAYTAY